MGSGEATAWIKDGFMTSHIRHQLGGADGQLGGGLHWLGGNHASSTSAANRSVRGSSTGRKNGRSKKGHCGMCGKELEKEEGGGDEVARWRRAEGMNGGKDGY